MSSLHQQREEFEAWAEDLKRKPQDPAFALVRATIEQTQAIYALATLIADMIDREETREERQQKTNLELYHAISGQPHE